MTTTTDLPAPPHWRSRTYRLLLATLIVLVIAGWLGMLTVRGVRHAHWVAATVTATSGLAMALLGAIVVAGRLGVPRPRRRQWADATVLDLQPIRGAVVFALVLFVVASGLVVFDRSAASADLPVSNRLYGKLIVVFVVSVLVTAASLPGIGRHVGRLTLSPEGISLVDYWGKTRRVAWAEITDIGDQALRGKTFAPIVIARRDGGPLVINSAPAYDRNGAALYWMLRHYWQTPAEHLELISGIALERLAQRRFPVR